MLIIHTLYVGGDAVPSSYDVAEETALAVEAVVAADVLSAADVLISEIASKNHQSRKTKEISRKFIFLNEWSIKEQDINEALINDRRVNLFAMTGIVQWLTVQTDYPLTRATHSFRFVESATAGTTATRARRSLDVRSSNASGKVSSG